MTTRITLSTGAEMLAHDMTPERFGELLADALRDSVSIVLTSRDGRSMVLNPAHVVYAKVDESS